MDLEEQGVGGADLFLWLRVGNGGSLSWRLSSSFRLCKRRMSLLTSLAAISFHEGICSMGLVSQAGRQAGRQAGSDRIQFQLPVWCLHMLPEYTRSFSNWTCNVYEISVLTAASLKVTSCWDIAPCSLCWEVPCETVCQMHVAQLLQSLSSLAAEHTHTHAHTHTERERLLCCVVAILKI
jgi:hypothetical protein